MEMEKTCEFCRLLRPVVYCKADAAHLCLSCDAKVHSANALSNRHPRTLVCEFCRHRPAHVRCSNHQLFMCRGCDCSQHDFSSEHQKREIGCYTGCPSAKDLAALWGFDLNQLKNGDFFGSTSNGSVDAGQCNVNVPRGSSVVSTVESMMTTVSAKSNLKSRGKHIKATRKDIQQAKNPLVLQQILDLNRLQLSESSHSSSIHVRDLTNASTEDGTALKLNDNEDGLNEEITEKPFTLPFSQLDHLTDTGNTLNMDSIWQFKSPFLNNQLWPQNMQDLGVCDELRFLDDFKMPDFDLTFQNFEEIFGAEQDPTGSVLDDNDPMCSSLANCTSIDTSEDTSVQQSVCTEKDNGATGQVRQFHQTKESLKPNQPSYSASPLFRPMLGGESSRNAYVRHEHPCHSVDAKSRGRVEGGETVTRRHKEKNFRRHEKQVQRASYKRSKSDVKKRAKGLAMEAEGYESDTANGAARSF